MHLFKLSASLLSIALMLALCGCGTDVTVAGLQCEYLDNPLAIDNVEPHFSWKMNSSEAGAGSVAYQILVASSPDRLNEADADLWDSGRVDELNTVMAVYEGCPLASEAQAWWKVRVWDQDGEPSQWSEPASFGVGLLGDDAWADEAEYIGLSGNEESPEAAPLLR